MSSSVIHIFNFDFLEKSTFKFFKLFKRVYRLFGKLNR